MGKQQKKKVYPVQSELYDYLRSYNHCRFLPVQYEDLCHFQDALPVYDKDDEDTLWRTAIYPQHEFEKLSTGLCKVYSQLKSNNLVIAEYLEVDRIDFCTFANSSPFRIRIRNRFNDNHDHFYVKKTDASRIYGLEFENLLCPTPINYFVFNNTLVEEHIIGIPGDVFMDHHIKRPEINPVRLSKEFAKFVERCFCRLLGDMRSYNYVISITPDIEDSQYRVRAIDFDQQAYEGDKTLYFPEFFSENKPIIDMAMKVLEPQTIQQYQIEERALIARRLRFTGKQFLRLLKILTKDEISTPEKTDQLKRGLAEFQKDKSFLKCSTMGEVIRQNLRTQLTKGHKIDLPFKF